MNSFANAWWSFPLCDSSLINCLNGVTLFLHAVSVSPSVLVSFLGLKRPLFLILIFFLFSYSFTWTCLAKRLCYIMHSKHNTHTKIQTCWFGHSGAYVRVARGWCWYCPHNLSCVMAHVALLRLCGASKEVRCVQFLVGVHLTDLSLTLWPRSVLSSFLLVSETQPGEFLTPSVGCLKADSLKHSFLISAAWPVFKNAVQKVKRCTGK